MLFKIFILIILLIIIPIDISHGQNQPKLSVSSSAAVNNPDAPGEDIKPEIVEVLRQKKAQEVMIEAKIMQINLDDEYLQGVDWEAIVSNYQSLPYPGGDNVRLPNNGYLSLGTITEEDYEVLLEALDTIGMISTVSNVRMSLADDKEAEISVKLTNDLIGLKKDKDDSGRTAKEIRVVLSSQQEEDHFVTVSIKPELVTMARGLRFNSSGGVSKGQDSTSVKVEDGGTIVIGGLFKELRIGLTRKIPLLGDLPFVGFVFRNEKTRIQKIEIIIFLTPKIITES